MSSEKKTPDQPEAAAPGAAGPEAAGIEKWIRVALIASLGANIFLGGFIAARVIGPGPELTGLKVVDLKLRGLPQGLSAVAREELEDSLRGNRREIRSAYRDYQQQQREINRLLTEDLLNEPEIMRAQSTLRALNAQIQAQMQRALMHAVKELNIEARREMIELRRIPRLRRFGRPESVDGSRWRFNWRDGDGFQMDMDGRGIIVDIPSVIIVEIPETEEDGD